MNFFSWVSDVDFSNTIIKLENHIFALNNSKFFMQAFFPLQDTLRKNFVNSNNPVQFFLNDDSWIQKELSKLFEGKCM